MQIVHELRSLGYTDSLSICLKCYQVIESFLQESDFVVLVCVLTIYQVDGTID